MSWKVEANAWSADGPHRKVVLEVSGEEFTEDDLRMLAYWVRNAEPGEKVTVERFTPGRPGK